MPDWASCQRARVPITIENPAASRLWLIPSLRRATRQPRFARLVTRYCQDGTPWKKPPGILGYRAIASSLGRHCQGPRSGYRKTKKPHHILLIISRQALFLALVA